MGIRLGRLRRKEKEETTSQLDLDSNAWWADRETLSRAFGEPEPEEPTPADTPAEGAGNVWKGSGAGKGAATDRDGRVDSVDYGGDESGRGTTNAPANGQIFVFPDGQDPFETLDIEQGGEWDDVVAAHRKLVKNFHPDRFGTAAPEVQAEAESRMSSINAAFQQIESLYRR